MSGTLVYDLCEQCDENPAFEPSPICAKCHTENEKRTIETGTASFQARIKELEAQIKIKDLQIADQEDQIERLLKAIPKNEEALQKMVDEAQDLGLYEAPTQEGDKK